MKRVDRTAQARAARPFGTALVCTCLFAGAASAQEASPPQWQFYLTPYLWIAGVSGTIKTPNPNVPGQQVDAGFGDVLSHLDAIPIMAAAEVRYGPFGLLTDIMAISVKSDIETNNRLFTGGSARLTQIVGTALGMYRVVDADRQWLDLGVGVRAFGMATTFSLNAGRLPGFSISPGASWADPIVAARYHLSFSSRWGLTAYGDIGGGPDSELTWQLLGTIDYQMTNSTVMQIGFRHLQFEYEGNVLHQNMGMTGPIVAGTMRF